MILAIGEILFDLFPNYRTPGGAPFNFAFHLSKLGLEVKVITRVGQDESGSEMIDYVRAHAMDISGIQTDETHETGKVQVTLDGKGVPDFYICPNMAYDYINFDKLADLQKPVELLYFGTLIQRTESSHQRLNAFLEKMKSQAKLFCDLNLRTGCYQPQVIMGALKHADIIKLNDFELSEIAKILGKSQKEDDLVFDLQQQFQIEVISLTKGEAGSVIYKNGLAYRLTDPKLVKANPLVDTVGAGDAYAAVLAFGLLHHWAPHDILHRATLLASHICSIRGAIPRDNLIYRKIRY